MHDEGCSNVWGDRLACCDIKKREECDSSDFSGNANLWYWSAMMVLELESIQGVRLRLYSLKIC